MALKRRRAGARPRIPELDGPVVGAGRELLRIGREGHGLDRVAVALKRRRAGARA